MPEPTVIHGDMSMPTIPEAPLPEPLTRAERVRALRGKYAWIPFSSDDHVREKHEEMDREEH
jgi:hypothetical protein